jgi:mRNA-degrading endonuclease RelE of RelBE toxin-antitoxin system
MNDIGTLRLLELSSKAERDLRKLAKRSRADARSVRDGLDQLRRGAANLDVKQVQGHPPWWRMRVGDWRVLYRPLTAGEVAELSDARGAVAGSSGFLVFRIVNRADLERGVETLP